MASWVDLSALHNPTPGVRPPASWGDGIVNNLDFLSAAEADSILTSQTTTSTTFVDLSTVGPSVSVDCGTSAIAIISCQASTSGAGGIVVGVAVSGATTVAATGDNSLYIADAFGAAGMWGTLLIFTGLTAGTNVFTMKYSVVGAVTGTFQRRKLAVIPLR